jgi:uncharacterized membrane protein YdjX (TVP38/TMEM64 family)
MSQKWTRFYAWYWAVFHGSARVIAFLLALGSGYFIGVCVLSLLGRNVDGPESPIFMLIIFVPLFVVCVMALRAPLVRPSSTKDR